ncbi:hypothetical protein GGS21DRAFT_489642 [Xylaria nigripes]|nr:hypothetical protein GGS21DRAFT_489642 [Xylaria nigripes]
MSDHITYKAQLQVAARVNESDDDLTEAKVKLAVQAFQSGKYPTVRAASSAYDAPYHRTLCRVKGRHSRKHNGGNRTILNEASDRALHAALQRLILWGTHISSHRLWRIANQILVSTSEPEKLPHQVKHRWARRYLARYRHLFKRMKGKPQSLERRLANNYANLEAWFYAFKACCDGGHN